MDSGVKRTNFIFKLALIAVLVLQTMLIVCTALEKRDLHIDESYSYILSNSFDGDNIPADGEVWNRWTDGERMLEFGTVQRGERFAYGKVYHNNALDAHPPLYYFILHTVCSFFPDSLSMSYGIALNIVIALGSALILYTLGKECMEDERWALLPVMLWGSSALFVDTAVLIRMYELNTFFTLCLTLLFIRIYKYGTNGKRYFAIFAVCFLGSFTHYYFCLYACILTVILGLWLWHKEGFGRAFIMGLCMLAGVVLVFVLYPAGIKQITGSSTNNVGREVWGVGVLNFKFTADAVTKLTRYFVSEVLQGMTKLKLPTALLALGFMAAAAWGLAKKKLTLSGKGLVLPVIGLAVFAVTFVLSGHIAKYYAEIRYVYNIIPIFYLSGVVLLQRLAKSGYAKKLVCGLLIGVAVLSFCGNMLVKSPYFLFADNPEFAQECERLGHECPNVFILGKTNAACADCYTRLIDTDRIYLTSYEDLENFDEIFDGVDVSDGVVVYVYIYSYDGDQVVSSFMERTELFTDFEFIGRRNICDVYLLK